MTRLISSLRQRVVVWSRNVGPPGAAHPRSTILFECAMMGDCQETVTRRHGGDMLDTKLRTRLVDYFENSVGSRPDPTRSRSGAMGRELEALWLFLEPPNRGLQWTWAWLTFFLVSEPLMSQAPPGACWSRRECLGVGPRH